MRRTIDVAVSGIGLLFLAVPLLLVSILAFLAQGAPVFFVQTRSGLYGAPFRLVKFRTMRNAFAADGKPLPDDQRTTRFGAMLRRTRIDELPQLWNVLRGDMSLIGPRPLLPASIAQAVGAGVFRGTVRPGMTGWAQVNGNTRLNDADKILLDNWYIANRTVGCDVTIILRTIGVALFGERTNKVAIRRAHAGDLGRRR
jgi:lipopolysaccharide/colanic/teichoic acid biosynthesis glycosyltransferase